MHAINYTANTQMNIFLGATYYMLCSFGTLLQHVVTIRCWIKFYHFQTWTNNPQQVAIRRNWVAKHPICWNAAIVWSGLKSPPYCFACRKSTFKNIMLTLGLGQKPVLFEIYVRFAYLSIIGKYKQTINVPETLPNSEWAYSIRAGLFASWNSRKITIKWLSSSELQPDSENISYLRASSTSQRPEYIKIIHFHTPCWYTAAML